MGERPTRSKCRTERGMDPWPGDSGGFHLEIDVHGIVREQDPPLLGEAGLTEPCRL